MTKQILVEGEPIDYSGIPEHMRGAMQRYMEHKIKPGGFLTALLENDLMSTLRKADDINKQRLYDYIVWLRNHAPSGSFGSNDVCRKWLD